ncbi:MAG: hypothetical protein KIS92_26275 [Planctomycetota bacterium]|nr:hypothetical protein [Planctomycetota bacterium]
MSEKSDKRSDEEKISDILLREYRYKREAYRFVQEALEYTVRKRGKRGHVSGRELALGVRDLARERFGLMAKTVLSQWGIKCTKDIGELVFNMVEEEIMIKQDSDTHEDFENVYDFDEAFGSGFQLDIGIADS